jgi:hypothetical protein
LGLTGAVIYINTYIHFFVLFSPFLFPYRLHMSGIQNKNLIFYSLHPNDKLSKLCLEELDKMPEFKKQFIPICIHDPRDVNRPPTIRLPQKVEDCKRKGLIPILAIAGFKEAIFATSALSWIKESALKTGDALLGSNIHGGGVADNCSLISQAGESGNSLFDTDYNIGFSTAKGEFNKNYANIDEAAESKIVTYDESSDKNNASSEISQRLEQLKFNRDQDMPNQRQMPQMPRQMNNQQMPRQMNNQQMPNMNQQMPQMPMGQMPNRDMPPMGQMPNRDMPPMGQMPNRDMPPMGQMPNRDMPPMGQMMQGMSSRDMPPMPNGMPSSNASYMSSMPY